MACPSPPQFPDDDPLPALHLPWEYARSVSGSGVGILIGTLAVSSICMAAACYGFGLDETLSWLSDFVPMAIAVVGIIMSYKQPKEKDHFAARAQLF